ncbi:hypothetical protein BFL22_06700 [Escherichia coli]|nr:hypothetical protein BFL22_06700 [Escherichia coli]
MLPSETMIWQPEFTDKTLSRKPGAVHPDSMGTGQMVVDDEIGYRNQLTVSAVPTFYPGFTAYSRLPFVSAGRRVP